MGKSTTELMGKSMAEWLIWLYFEPIPFVFNVSDLFITSSIYFKDRLSNKLRHEQAYELGCKFNIDSISVQMLKNLICNESYH